MSSNTRDGWAARRAGGCFESEKEKTTWDEWWACCPPGTQSFTDGDNNSGCGIKGPPKETPTLCANSTLVLWSDDTGYFCCDPDQTGFITDKAWKGCAPNDELDDVHRNKTLTIANKEGRSPEPTTSSSFTVSSELSTPTITSDPSSSSGSPSSTQPAESSDSSTDKGAIAGGVVGGFFCALMIVGMVWLFLRWRRHHATAEGKNASISQPPGPKSSLPSGDGQYTSPELYGDPSQHELPGNHRPRHELA
ncbi:hypothetical protein N8T08_007814 [Aspergillus melleus]|uniref:Uncharacterized protein n=1 Tax=Aspergillus melleus TaxID=138277 RepID=A0ACC3AWZ2_9EURO|nr:hypothetical protein N8T08_007814 [Aspergillus melleus]